MSDDEPTMDDLIRTAVDQREREKRERVFPPPPAETDTNDTNDTTEEDHDG